MTSRSEVRKRNYPKLIGTLLVVASVFCIIALFIIDINVIFEPPYLLPVTNTIFTAIIPLAIAFFAARTYLKNGSLSVFLMGCGMLSFGISAAFAGWLRPAQNGANINVTIYNTGALVGSLFHITGAVLSFFGRSPQLEFEKAKLVAASSYCAIIAFIILFTFATFEQIIPPFFIQGSGPTALRQIVLGLAIFFYLLSAIFFMDNYLKTKSDFFYWYSLGLAMLALGLFAFYIQRGVGSPIGWAGRTTNYIGAIFSLVAILTAIRSGRSKGLALEDAISSFFRDAEANFRSLVETATDAIISYDQEDRIILWNTGAERISGYTKGEAVGAPFFILLIPEEYTTVMQDLIGSPKFHDDSSHSRRTAEIEVKRKDGGRLPVEVSAFVRKLPMGWVRTCIVRDIAERKKAEEALRQERNFISAVLETEGALVVVLDNQGRITRFNRTCEDVTGYSAADVQDRVFWEFLVPSEDLAGVKTTWEALNAGAFPNTHENHWVAKDGSRRLIAWSNTALISEAGAVQHIIGTGIDITERKRAEVEFQMLAQQRQLALDAAHMGWWHYDPITREASWDDRYREIFGVTGYSRPNDEILARLHPEDLPGVWAKVEAALDPVNSQAYSAEYRINLPDGSMKWIEAQGIASFEGFGENRRATSLVGTVADITDRKRAEEALRERERLLQDVIDGSTSPIFLKDRDGRFITINAALEQMLGMSREEIKGKTDYDIAPKEVADYWGGHDKKVMAIGKAIQIEEVADLPDGHHIFLANKFPLVDAHGEIYGLGAISHDITARKRAEEALKESESRERARAAELQALVDAVPGIVFIAYDPQCRKMTGSRATNEFLRLQPDDNLSKSAPSHEQPLTFRAMKSGIDVPPEELPVQQAAKGHEVRDYELDIVFSDGAVSTIFGNASPVFDEHGNPRGAIGVFVDVTERKQAEQALAEHVAKLQEINKELESFSYSISHDLRAPLRAIDGYARMLLKKHGHEFDEDSTRKFNVIRSSSQMMGNLIDDILTLSRLGRAKMSIVNLEMDGIIKDVWKELQTINPERNMDLTILEMPAGYGDRTLIKQVYANLLGNAVKFTKYKNPAQIEAGGYTDGNEHVYYVKDNGVGFDMAYYDKLFGIFQRLHNNPDFEGTGVGLATIQRAIHRHGGRVWAEGKVDEGATFYFSLPLSLTCIR